MDSNKNSNPIVDIEKLKMDDDTTTPSEDKKPKSDKDSKNKNSSKSNKKNKGTKGNKKNESSDEETDVKKKTGRSLEDIINKFKWDPTYDQDNCVIGYDDRFVGKIRFSDANSKLTKNV